VLQLVVIYVNNRITTTKILDYCKNKIFKIVHNHLTLFFLDKTINLSIFKFSAKMEKFQNENLVDKQLILI